jgi:hypothetical protein
MQQITLNLLKVIHALNEQIPSECLHKIDFTNPNTFL